MSIPGDYSGIYDYGKQSDDHGIRPIMRQQGHIQ